MHDLYCGVNRSNSPVVCASYARLSGPENIYRSLGDFYKEGSYVTCNVLPGPPIN